MLKDESDSPLAIAITGASGRMGQMLVRACSDDISVVLSAAFCSDQSAIKGKDVGTTLGLNTSVIAQPAPTTPSFQVLIDFSRPAVTLQYLSFCVQHQIGMVIGTTGFSALELETIHQAARQIPILLAPNTSIGVNATLQLIQLAATLFQHGYDTEIIEAHHKHKVDAPSGTALKIGEVIAKARGQNLADVAVFGREGNSGSRREDSIGFASVRGGDIVGEHTVLFAGEGERIKISHQSSGRMSYALGAIRAAKFIAKSQHGIFDMTAVLGLN